MRALRLGGLAVVLAACGAKPVTPFVLSGRLLLPAGAIDGEVLVGSDGHLVCAAASCASAAGYSDAKQLSVPGAVISPGLINAHDHLPQDTVGPQDHALLRYQHRHDWRVGAEGATKLPTVPSATDPSTTVAAELRGVLGGATSTISSGGARGLLRNLAGDDRDGLTGKAAVFDTFPLGDSDGTLLESGCGYPAIASASKAFAGSTWVPHVAEGINRAAQNELGCLKDLLGPRTAIIHGVGLDARDAASVSMLVWSPRSNLSLYGDTARITVFQRAGASIALGTDWLPSGSMNLLRELACAASFAPTLGSEELWKMVTVDAARAGGVEEQLGTLEPGKLADLAVFVTPGASDHRAVVSAEVDDVRLVVRGGRPLYGDAELVETLSPGCATLDVCGAPRRVCLDDTGAKLSEVQAAAASSYPLFFCRGTAPTSEPTCTPYRDSYPGGVTALDRDGDGVLDAMDLCPDVFDPVRPLDGAKQADVDGDGFGDACDAAPLDAAAH